MDAQPVILKCPYCGGAGTLQSAERVFPGQGHGPMYICENYPRCDAYVRCHQGTSTPMGVMANRRLRRLRTIAHEQFDPLWNKNDSALGRKCAYQAAATVMEVDEFHIGHLDEAMCEHCIECISLVDIEMDRRLNEHAQLGAPPQAHTIEALSALFHPGENTFRQSLPWVEVAFYDVVCRDALRHGLLVQEHHTVKLTHKGIGYVYPKK